MQGGNALDRVGIPLCRVGMLSRALEWSRQSWNAFYRVGMFSTELEYLCTELECFLQS
jgi:signal-transduction protein with cAMP-binding, CBS, and nucleotidyltransferase domain